MTVDRPICYEVINIININNKTNLIKCLIEKLG